MNLQTTIIDRNDPDAVDISVQTMLRGDISVFPCDTIYGLSGLEGISEFRLRNVKSRPDTKKFIILANMEMVEALSGNHLPKGLKEAWPGALTAIINTVDGDTVAVRVPDDTFLQTVISGCGSPIYSTSVNTSGEPPLLSFDAIVREFSGKVSLIVRGGADQGVQASTLVDCTQTPYVLIRQGAFDASSLIRESDKDPI